MGPAGAKAQRQQCAGPGKAIWHLAGCACPRLFLTTSLAKLALSIGPRWPLSWEECSFALLEDTNWEGLWLVARIRQVSTHPHCGEGSPSLRSADLAHHLPVTGLLEQVPQGDVFSLLTAVSLWGQAHWPFLSLLVASGFLSPPVLRPTQKTFFPANSPGSSDF